ncbi:MAG TPA: hypothetical protein VN704_05285 [Verrucomicrobiae bacterium]|nr:hypothetical protein [Verrucomicrobiae bacterium]
MSTRNRTPSQIIDYNSYSYFLGSSQALLKNHFFKNNRKKSRFYLELDSKVQIKDFKRKGKSKNMSLMELY